MVELYRFDFRRVERNRVLFSCLLNQILFFDEEKLRLRVDEPLDQPRAGNAINFDVFPCNPFHIFPRGCQE